MPPRKNFTPEEDMTIWRIAIELQTTKKLGEQMKEKMTSNRLAASLNNRFRLVLLPRLRNTKFHSETKLKLCQVHKYPVEGQFLEELEKDASVQVDEGGFVTGYNLNPESEENKDMELSDEDFIKITSPVVAEEKKFSAEEDAEIWKYVLENHTKFSRGATFWNGLAQRLGRPNTSFLPRFIQYLAPTLHTMNFPVEDKLKLYKKCKITVDKEYLEELDKYAELKMDKNGCITGYKLKNGRPEKRKNTGKTRGRPKKARGNGSEQANVQKDAESTGNEEDEEELIFDGVVQGTGFIQPERIITIPKVEAAEDLPLLREPNFTDIVVPAFVRQIKAEFVEPAPSPNVREEVVEEDPNETIRMIKEAIQRIEEKMDNQDASVKTSILEMTEGLKGFIKTTAEQQAAKLKKDLEAYLDAKISEQLQR